MSAHIIEFGDLMLALQFANEHPDDLNNYAARIELLAAGAMRGAREILKNDNREEGGAPRGAAEAVEAAELLQSLARALRESAVHAAGAAL